MANWRLTDADESGYEYECTHCHRHISVRIKGQNLPKECPYCGMKIGVERKTNRVTKCTTFENGKIDFDYEAEDGR